MKGSTLSKAELKHIELLFNVSKNIGKRCELYHDPAKLSKAKAWLESNQDQIFLLPFGNSEVLTFLNLVELTAHAKNTALHQYDEAVFFNGGLSRRSLKTRISGVRITEQGILYAVRYSLISSLSFKK